MKLCVVGCERSGTSAISSLLSKAADWSYLDDPAESWYALRLTRASGIGLPFSLRWKLRRHDVVKVPGFAAILPELQKSKLGRFKTLYCIRDPRDVMASVIERMKFRYTTLFTDSKWLKIVAKDHFESLAWRWCKYLETAMAYHEEGGEILFLRYEDFLEDRLGTLEKSARILGLPFETKRIEALLNVQFKKKWGDQIKGAQRWRDDLSQEAIQTIEKICGPIMQLWGYEMTTGSNSTNQSRNPGKSVETPTLNPPANLTPSGILLPKQPGPRVCIVAPTMNTYSETFIRYHMERLPTTVRVLYGSPLPQHFDNGKQILSPRIYHRALRLLRQRLFFQNPESMLRKAVEKFLKAQDIQVVFAEYGICGVALVEACQNLDIPLVVHFHGYDAHQHETVRKYQRQYRQLFNQASKLIAASRHMRDRLIELGANEDKILLSPYGVETDFFTCGQPENAPPHFVAVGRFVDKKAPHLTLLAFSKVAEKVPDSSLTMIGEGPLLEACRNLAHSLGLNEKVTFMGAQPPDKIVEVLKTARAFVQHSIQTSYGDCESLGVVFLEAGACGLPIVATQHDGIPDVILDGETGYLVQEGDVESMAGYMIQLAENPEQASKMGQAGRKRIQEHFQLKDSMNRLWQVLQDCL